MELQRAVFKGGWEKKNANHRKLRTKPVGTLRHANLASEREESVFAWLVYQREVKR